MRKETASALVILVLLAVSMLPHSRQRIRAYPENLWTSAGGFGEPSGTAALLEWERTEYGVFGAWLVHDACTSEPAWAARIEPRFLALHAGSALLGGLVTFVFAGRRIRRGLRFRSPP